MKGFKNANIYIEGQGIIKTNLLVENGKIKEIGDIKNTDGFLDLEEGLIVVPGFIDKHIHGANHSDAMYPTYKDIENISKTILKEGTTSYLPTTMTQSIDAINAALVNIKNYIENPSDGAEILGIHLEGPFISKKMKGAQPEEYIIPCDVEQFIKFQEASGGNIKQVTLAYEENGAELVKYLKEHNIVASIGHSVATAEQVLEAARLGLCSATHTFNAMKGLHHREAGTLGGVLLSEDINSELISDLVHVSENAMKVLHKVKGNNISLVTDSMEAAHLPDGKYSLGGQDVFVVGNEARLADGTLAGSVLLLNHGVRNTKNVLGLSLEEAVDLASLNPAKVVGVADRKGSIKVGKDADFAVVDKDLNVYYTIVAGKVLYKKEVI